MAYKIIDAQGNQLGQDYRTERGAKTAKTRLANQGKEPYVTAQIVATDSDSEEADSE